MTEKITITINSIRKNNDNSIHHDYKENCFFGHILIPIYNKFGTIILGGRQYHSKQLE